MLQRQAGQDRRCGLGQRGQLVAVGGLVFQQQGRLPGDLEGGDLGRRVGQSLPDPQRHVVQQLEGGRPGAHQVGQRAVGGAQVVEHQQRRTGVPAQRNGAQRDLRDETERAFAADDQVRQDLARIVEVQQRVEAITHGVLHRELLTDFVHRRRVGTHPVAQPQQAVKDLRLVVAQPRVGIGGTGVDHRARRQHHHHRIQCAVGVFDGAAGHAAGVVGDDAADRAGAFAGRIGTDLAAVTRQLCVEPEHRHAGLCADPGTVVEHLRRAEALADVDENAVRHRLTRQARAAGPQGERDSVTGTDGEQPAHLGRVAGSDDHLRGEQEVRRVVGRGMTVQGQGTDTGRVTGRLDQCIDQRFGHRCQRDVTPGAGP